MAVVNFIPEIWSARLLTALQTRHVGAVICNRDYEGDVTPGATVNITSVADPTIDNYDGSDFTFDELSDATRALVVDQAKFFAIKLDDVDRVQAVNGGALLAEGLQRAGYKLADELDQFLLDKIASGAGHQLTETTITSAAKAYEHLVDLSVLLDESDVPEFGRWAVVSPAFYGVLQKDDRFVKSGAASGAATLANGVVGSAAGFTVLKSNNIPAAVSGTSSSNKFVLAGTSIATTLAEQIDKVEAVRLERSFGDGVKGLHVYGAKVLRPTCLVASDLRINLS